MVVLVKAPCTCTSICIICIYNYLYICASTTKYPIWTLSFETFWAMAKTSAVWWDSTLRFNSSVILFPPSCTCIASNLEPFSPQQFSHQLLLLLCVSLLRCSCSAYGCLYSYFSFVTALIQQALFHLHFFQYDFSWLLIFPFLYHVLFISLSYTYVLFWVACLAPKTLLLPLFLQHIFAVYLSKTASNCFKVFLVTILQIDFDIIFCQSFVSQGTCYIFLWHPLRMFYNCLQASPGQHSLD